MKLNKLASAVSVSLVALTLAACGSDSNSSSPVAPTTPTTPPSTDSGPLPTTPTTPTDPSTSVPGGSNEVVGGSAANSPIIGGFDSSEHLSHGASHYANRGVDANYDRVLNSNKEFTGSNSNPMTLSLNAQNPYLTNFILGAEGVYKDGVPVVYGIDYLGEYYNPDIKQKENVGGTATSYPTKDLKGNIPTYIVPDIADRNTIQEENKNNALVLSDADAALLKKTTTNTTGTPSVGKDEAGLTGLIAYETKVSAFGVAQEESTVRFGQEDAKSTSTTRVFGKNYRDYEAGATGAQNSDNSYKGTFDKDGNLVALSNEKLNHVQYGRLTANIDALADKVGNPEDFNESLIYRPFTNKGQAGAVDTYFYRGTNATTAEQMAAIKAKGGELQYLGHALTYGLGNVTAAAAATTPPNAFGQTDSQDTIGNFVQATYNTATDKVSGSVYNFIDRAVNNTTDGDYKKQDLITFEGDVRGNTVLGSATNQTSVKSGVNTTGTLVASFYGSNAEELGGSITSISRGEEFYGPSAWGAVFGAQQVPSAPVTTNEDVFNWTGNQGK